MPHTAKTALLNPQSWDLQLTKEGNILLTSGALAIAQNLANEIRLWTNDAYFQQANGIAWKEAQLAKKLDSSVLAQLIHEAGNRVDGVKSVDSVDITELIRWSALNCRARKRFVLSSAPGSSRRFKHRQRIRF